MLPFFKQITILLRYVIINNETDQNVFFFQWIFDFLKKRSNFYFILQKYLTTLLFSTNNYINNTIKKKRVNL